MDYTIIDAHSHLWLKQDTEVDGKIIRTEKKRAVTLYGGNQANASSFYDRRL